MDRRHEVWRGALGLAVACACWTGESRGESLPLCPSPMLFVGNGRMPVDALGVGLEVPQSTHFTATVERLGTDAGAPTTIATETVPSDEPGCNGDGYRVEFLEPLEIGQRHQLVVTYGCEPPFVLPSFEGAGLSVAEFVAIEPLVLPESIGPPEVRDPMSTSPAGCGNRQQLQFQVDPVGVSAPDAGVDYRELMHSALVRDGACLSQPIYANCPDDDGIAEEAQWLYRIPHSGVGLSSDLVTITVTCDPDFDAGPCVGAPAPESEPGPASGGDDGGSCALTRLGVRSENGCWLCVAGLLAVFGARRSRFTHRPRKSTAGAETRP